jgi:hypothetical protein
LQGSTPQFPGRQDFRRDGEVGGQDGHLQHDATRALRVDQQQVVGSG